MSYAARDYHLAAIPEPFQVLGVRLVPLSLHHCILMEACGVAFVSSKEEVPMLNDLVLGVLICSKRWSEGEFEGYIDSKKCHKDIARWARVVARQMDAQDYLQIHKRFEIFRDYIQRFSAEPGYWQTQEGSKSGSSGAHWSQCILLTLTSHCGYTRHEALHCPLSQLLADYYRHAESQGLVQLMREYEFAKATGVPS